MEGKRERIEIALGIVLLLWLTTWSTLLLYRMDHQRERGKKCACVCICAGVCVCLYKGSERLRETRESSVSTPVSASPGLVPLPPLPLPHSALRNIIASAALCLP